MKLLHIINELNTGGAELTLTRLVSGGGGGHQHGVLSLAAPGPLVPRIQTAGVEVACGNINPGRPNPLQFCQLLRFSRRFNPDLIVGWLYHSCVAAEAVAARLCPRVPTLWRIGRLLPDNISEKRTTRAVFRLLRRLAARPAWILYDAEAAADQHERAGLPAGKRWVIPNGFDTDLFVPAGLEQRLGLRARYHLPPDAIVFGVAARRHPDKDHENLLQAFPRVVAQLPSARLALLGRGTGSDDPVMARLVAASGVGTQIDCLGELTSPAEMAALYPLFDVYVSSSRTEAFPNSVGEAMACGLPCVATDVGGTSQLLGASGRLVPPRDPVALAAAMLAMARDQDRHHCGARARARVVAQFSLQRMRDNYTRLFEAATAGCPQPVAPV